MCVRVCSRLEKKYSGVGNFDWPRFDPGSTVDSLSLSRSNPWIESEVSYEHSWMCPKSKWAFFQSDPICYFPEVLTQFVHEVEHREGSALGTSRSGVCSLNLTNHHLYNEPIRNPQRRNIWLCLWAYSKLSSPTALSSFKCLMMNLDKRFWMWWGFSDELWAGFCVSNCAPLHHTAYPHWLERLNDTQLDSGSPLRWECKATGKPPPTYRWLRNGAPLQLQVPPTQRPSWGSENLFWRSLDEKHHRCRHDVLL